MTEPPRPPGEGYPGGMPDPTSPPPAQPGSFSVPGEAPASGFPPPPSGEQYAPPPPAGGAYAPPPGGGYPPPPGGGYPPQGAYQPGPAPIGYANNDEKTFALVAHFGGAAGMFVLFGVGGFIGPLIAYMAKGQQSPTVRAHAIAALNFQLLWSIVGVIGWVTACIFIGWLILLAAGIIGIVFGVIAGLKANEGQLYKYPMSISVIK